jgi:tetratricopeptide (TPR) repeat protein
MDGRLSLVLALGLLGNTCGCVLSGNLVTPGKEASPAPAPADKEGPKKSPKATTWLAFANYREGVAANPELPEAYRSQMRDEAIRIYQKALETDPNCLAAYAGLARLYGSAGEHAQAVQACQKALKLRPKEAALWYELGMCYARQKEWTQAIAKLRIAVRTEPANRRYVTSLAFCLARVGQYRQSVALFSRVAGPAVGHYQVAKMAHHLHQDQVSKELLRVALRVKPDYAEARALLNRLEGRAASGPVVQAGRAN